MDLEHEELDDYFMPRSSESERNFEGMANIAQIIEENLPCFINRSNVTAVYPSYKISNFQTPKRAKLRGTRYYWN